MTLPLVGSEDGHVTLGYADGTVVHLPSVTPAAYADLQALVWEGRLDDPRVRRFLAELHSLWTAQDRSGELPEDWALLELLGLVTGAWTPDDDMALASLLGGDTPPE